MEAISAYKFSDVNFVCIFVVNIDRILDIFLLEKKFKMLTFVFVFCFKMML